MNEATDLINLRRKNSPLPRAIHRLDEGLYRAYIRHYEALRQITEYYDTMPRRYLLLRYACKRLIRRLTPLVENLRKEWEKGHVQTTQLLDDTRARVADEVAERAISLADDVEVRDVTTKEHTH